MKFHPRWAGTALFVVVTGVLVPSTASAVDRYWVCDSGSWDSNLCWSATAGGAGGASVPNDTDNIYLTAGNLTGDVYLGRTGTGTFTQSGGTVSGELHLGYEFGGNGSYTLSAGSLTAGFEHIGDNESGTGTFTQSGGTNTVGDLRLAWGSGSHGTFTQSGGTNTVSGNISLAYDNGSGTSRGTYALTGGTLNVGGNIVNGSGSSTFTINGGTLNVGGIVLGDDGHNLNHSDSIFTLSGTGSLTADYESIGPAASFPNGRGIFTQSGGTHTVTDLSIGSVGTYNLSGGTLHAGNISVNSAGNFNFNGGRLAVGTFNGSLSNNGGTLAPGNSPGTTNINGNYTQSALGVYAVDIGGLLAGTEHDVLNVSGTATLDGTLNISVIDLGSGLFTPHLGDSFDILTADLIQGSFSLFTLAALDPGLKWDINYLTDAIGTTDVVRLSVDAVPVPPAVWLFGSGLLGLVAVARRHKASLVRNQSAIRKPHLAGAFHF
jgi:hypothetical protein